MKDKETGLEIYGIPNAETRAAMKEADEIAQNHRARFSSAEELFEAIGGSSANKGNRKKLASGQVSVVKSKEAVPGIQRK